MVKLFLMLILISSSAFADSIDINLTSHHSHSCYVLEDSAPTTCVPYNQSNPGWGMTFDVTDYINATSGVYYNSYKEWSFYNGIGFDRSWYYNSIKFGGGVSVNLVSGYEHTVQTDKKLLLIALPHVKIGTKTVWFSIGYLPSWGTNTVSVITLQLHHTI